MDSRPSACDAENTGSFRPQDPRLPAPARPWDAHGREPWPSLLPADRAQPLPPATGDAEPGVSSDLVSPSEGSYMAGSALLASSLWPLCGSQPPWLRPTVPRSHDARPHWLSARLSSPVLLSPDSLPSGRLLKRQPLRGSILNPTSHSTSTD